MAASQSSTGRAFNRPGLDELHVHASKPHICKWNHHHHHVEEGLGLIPVPCILKMKLAPPSLPRSSYVSSPFWFTL